MVSTHSLGTRSIDLRVLGQLRVGAGVSRVELARQLSIAPSTIGTHVDQLVQNGLLRERRGETVAAGRPPTIVELNPEAGQFIGIDLDAREVYGASVDFSQRLLRDRTEMIGARESADEVIERIERVIEDVRDQSRDLLGIGIAVPGTVDVVAGRVLHYRYIRGWRDIALADVIASRFEVPVKIENNMRAMGLAERYFGQARTTDDFVCLGIRSGIGAGVFIDGEIHRGSNGMAGEVGVWPCEGSGAMGNSKVFGSSGGTLEEFASLRAIMARLAESAESGRSTTLKLVRNRVTLDALMQAIDDGDPLVMETLEQSAGAVGRALSQISLLLAPEKIIVSGPLATATEAFMTPLQKCVQQTLSRNQSPVPTVIASELGSLAGALGAATLAIHAWQPSEMKSGQPLKSGPATRNHQR